MEHTLSRQNTSHSKVFYQYVPIAFCAVTLLLMAFGFISGNWKYYIAWGEEEASFVEIATVAFAFVGLLIALNLFFHRSEVPTKLFGPWVILFVIGFSYLGGEEASWGQHIFEWQTPDWLSSINSRQETNLHNLFDKKMDRIPKAVVGFLIMFSGILWPLFCHFRKKPLNLPNWFNVLWPTKAIITIALCYFVIWVLDRTIIITKPDIFDGQKFHFSEFRELISAYFLMMYTWDFRRYLK